MTATADRHREARVLVDELFTQERNRAVARSTRALLAEHRVLAAKRRQRRLGARGTVRLAALHHTLLARRVPVEPVEVLQ